MPRRAISTDMESTRLLRDLASTQSAPLLTGVQSMVEARTRLLSWEEPAAFSKAMVPTALESLVSVITQKAAMAFLDLGTTASTPAHSPEAMPGILREELTSVEY